MRVVPQRIWLTRLSFAGTAAALGLAIFEVTRGAVSVELMRTVGAAWNSLATALSAPHMLDGTRLYFFAFIGGLIGSVSPCILGMLPVNLSYIGATHIGSRAAVMRSATLFVTGVVIVNTVLGLVASLFFAVFIEYRAEVNIAVGGAIVLMALWMARIVQIKMPGPIKAAPRGWGPIAAGSVFALIASPCSSPVLVTLLAVAGREGEPSRAIGAMAVYSIGYAAVLWVASIFTGFVAISRHFRRYGDWVSRISALVLGALGLGTMIYGFSLLL